MVEIKFVCLKVFWAKSKVAKSMSELHPTPVFKCYWLRKYLNQAPTAINKGSTDKALGVSKEGEMSSHLGKIKKDFKELTFGLRL